MHDAVFEVSRNHLPSLADTLARAMLDEPGGRFLFPDTDEFLAFHRRAYADTIGLALEEGRVDAWGEPIVGVAIWLVRPALDEIERRPGKGTPTSHTTTLVLPETAERIKQYTAVMRQLRARARPDRHAYLDSIGVLPDYRRRGIASALLDAGHAWADAARLPCALDTGTDTNVEFYQRHGYRIVASAPVPGSGIRLTALRRPEPWSVGRTELTE